MAEHRSQGWFSSSSKKPDTAVSTTPIPEASPSGSVAGYHGPAPMDLSAVKGKKITTECK
jgi:hypothetical protein